MNIRIYGILARGGSVQSPVLPLCTLPFLTLILLILSSCVSKRQAETLPPGGKDVEMAFAEALEIREYDGYTVVRTYNPWDSLRGPQTYLLTAKGYELPEDAPKGIRLNVPLENALVYSTVHMSLISELGASGSIGGVCGAEYITAPDLKQRLEEGSLTDCGLDLQPNMERIASLKPDAILLSPYDNNDRYGRVAGLGIPVVECGDYVETTPLGRAEWIRFYGRLFGRAEKADSIWTGIRSDYERMRGLAANCRRKPKVLMDAIYGQSWTVPQHDSSTAQIIRDAGGANPFDNFNGDGTVPLSPEQVLAMAKDADVWLVRYWNPHDKTLAMFGSESPYYTRFDAWVKGRVYGCNTANTDYFERTPFHPDLMLADLIMILHPDLANGKDTNYFKLLETAAGR